MGPARGVTALGGLVILPQEAGQDGGLAVLDVPGRGQQGQRSGRGQGAKAAEFLALRRAGQFVQVAAAELGELGRVVAVPLAQLGGRRDVPGPQIQPGRVLAQPPRP